MPGVGLYPCFFTLIEPTKIGDDQRTFEFHFRRNVRF
jgi:hypothetical protein